MAHPLTGPLEVRGAEPGDVLVVDVLGYETDDFGWTGDLAGVGLARRPLRAAVPGPLGARRRARPLRGRARRGRPRRSLRRGDRRRDVGGAVRAGARPRGRPGRAPGRSSSCRAPRARRRPPWRKVSAPSPRVRTAATWTCATSWPAAGCTCRCTCPGAMLSIGDLHFAQGDGEVCIAAIETGGSATVRVGVRRDGWKPALRSLGEPRRGPAGLLRHDRHPARPTTAPTPTST